jgi:hypothetical protein
VKKYKFWSMAVLMILSMVIGGCGGSNKGSKTYKIKIKWISGGQSQGSNIVNDVIPGSVLDPDGKDGKFVSSTGYIYEGDTWQRHFSLEAILFQNGIPVNVSPEQESEISWSSSQIDAIPVGSTGRLVTFSPSTTGKVTVTATYQNTSSTITVLVFKRIFMSDLNGCIPGITLSDYSYQFKDLKITQNGDNFTVNAPGGIALVEKRSHEYLDPTTRYNLGLITTVPEGLSYTTSIDVSGQESGIYIVKSADGHGYAKVAFCLGLCGPGWLPGLIDVYFEYSSTTNFNIAF